MRKVLGAFVSLCVFLSMSGFPFAAEAPTPGAGEPAVKADDKGKKSSSTKKKSTKKKSTKKKSSKKKSSAPKQQPASGAAGQ
jgi:hypothetical protein